MAYSSLAVANAFYDEAKKCGGSLSPMQMQKLVFIANGFKLAIEGSALVDDSFEVWRHGPVAPTLYRYLKSFGSNPITSPIKSWRIDGEDYETFTPSIKKDDGNSHNLIKKVFSVYGDVDAFALSEITHLPGSPWSKTKEAHGFNSVIPSDIIKNYYKNLLNS
ncbi:DUF4065 domain-containing protein [Tatumella terrea]|uniref:Panacea domain-containing protein n=1 Tax=Tatumella terrea TaxID=419007 RepID=UPI0031D0C1EE